MKRLLSTAAAVSFAALAFAQEPAAPEGDAQQQQRDERRRESSAWPAFFAICEYPASPDIAGVRITIPFSTRQENITGFDVGLWGRALYFEGFMVNVVRNDVRDDMAGLQAGLYNSAGGSDFLAVQAGLWNETGHFRGAQAGLVNLAGEARGLQVGLINRAETMYGYQVGLVNIIRDGELQFCPFLNIGF